jgi:hypothetical protein
MNIQPISIWKDGADKNASVFNLISVSDDLNSSAQFYYDLKEADYVIDEQTYSGELLRSGNLSMNAEEYQAWGAASDINLAAYQWAAAKLNLVLA